MKGKENNLFRIGIKFGLTVSRFLDNWQHGFYKGLGV